MSYIDKYRTNKDWANLAYEREEYDVAINRYYYSIFQKMLYELKSNGVTIKADKQYNSHTNTASQYAKELIQGNSPKDTFKTRTCFNSGFDSLKRLRYGADYTEQHSTLRQAKDAKSHFTQLDTMI